MNVDLISSAVRKCVMSRTLIVFRDNMIEREKLASEQSQSIVSREQRSDRIAATIASFRESVHQALARLRGASDQLEARGELGQRARRAVESGRIRVLSPLRIRAFESIDGAMRVTGVGGHDSVSVDVDEAPYWSVTR